MKKIVKILMRPHGQEAFLMKMYLKYKHLDRRICLLDIGCGNNSVARVKRYFPNCYYIGIDVGDYNLEPEAKKQMEKYYIVKPEEFSSKVSNFMNSVDIVMSNHNIEHCNEPQKVLENMTQSLKRGGIFIWHFLQKNQLIFQNEQVLLIFMMMKHIKQFQIGKKLYVG